MKTKSCTGCGIAKPVNEYHKSKSELYGVRARCKACISLKLKEQYKDNIHNRRLRNKISHYKNQYGLSISQFNEMRVKQEYKCAICNRKEAELGHIFRVDHDHDTGKVRELLCHNCNCGLGHFRDNIQLLELALNYLRKHEKNL
jgi:hypothetical protein